jgi:cytolysin-activating lysine-acyltransferase
MQFGKLDVTAPGLVDEQFNEAEVFGSAVWLCMHSESHREAPLHTLSALLLPGLKHRQFVLATQAGKPVFYLSWAMFDAEAESRYLASPQLSMQEEDWASGERMWIVDWIAPFGHTRTMSRLARQLFADRCVRSLYHRGDDKGLRILTFHGVGVLTQEARSWFETHPVSFQQPARMFH